MNASVAAEKRKQDVIDNINWDVRVSAADIDVSIEDDTVILSGTVPSYNAHKAAEANAFSVPGVCKVKNQLFIKPIQNGQSLDDSNLCDRIKSAMNLNANFRENNVKVDVKDGTAILEGNVSSFYRKLEAKDIALSVHGVRKVENFLSVTPDENVSDQVIADDIISVLRRNHYVIADAITIEVQDGVVKMNGTVPNWNAFIAANDAALLTRGVRDVKNNLVIRYI